MAAGTDGQNYWPVDQLTEPQREKLNTDGGWGANYCYYYYEPDEYEHDYILLVFNGIGPPTPGWEVTVHYRAPVGESYWPVKLYAWDGSEWDLLDTNDGGTDPPPENVDVTDYVDYGQLKILLQTRSVNVQNYFDVTYGNVDFE